MTPVVVWGLSYSWVFQSWFPWFPDPGSTDPMVTCYSSRTGSHGPVEMSWVFPAMVIFHRFLSTFTRGYPMVRKQLRSHGYLVFPFWMERGSHLGRRASQRWAEPRRQWAQDVPILFWSIHTQKRPKKQQCVWMRNHFGWDLHSMSWVGWLLCGYAIDGFLLCHRPARCPWSHV